MGADAPPGDSFILDANDDRGTDSRDKLVVGISVSVNPLNRAFVPRPLPESIDGHLRLARALVTNRRKSHIPSTERALCNSVETRLKNIKEAHRRGAAKVGLAGQFVKSASILASATFEDPSRATSRPKDPPSCGALAVPEPCCETASCTRSRRPCSPPSASSTCAPSRSVEVRAKPIEMERLPRDWEHMMDAVEMSWEVGVGSTPALKKLQHGQPDRVEWEKKQPFGRASSSMLSKRRAIAKAAHEIGGWTALRVLLRGERAKRVGRGETFGYNKVQMFCSAMIREK